MRNVFHVSWLKPYVGPTLDDVPDKQQPEILDEAEVIKPEQVLLHRWEARFRKAADTIPHQVLGSWHT